MGPNENGSSVEWWKENEIVLHEVRVPETWTTTETDFVGIGFTVELNDGMKQEKSLT